MKNKGPFSTYFIKKKARWPKHTESQEEIDELQGQYSGTIKTWKGTVASENVEFYMV